MSKSLTSTLNHHYSQFSNHHKCCVCGSLNCQEAADHSKLTLQNIEALLNSKLTRQQQFFEIKQNISQLYKNLKMDILAHLEQDEYHLQIHINKTYFETSTSKTMDLNLLSELIQHNTKQLPSRKISKLAKTLTKMPPINDLQQINSLKEKTQKLTQTFNSTAILQDLTPSLPLKQFIEDPFDLKLKPKTSISEVSNPQETDQAEQNKIYEWRNIRVTKNSKTVSLSNKNISDREVMEQIPILANYKNLKEFQIRNNKISCLSCNLIANNMPFLISVDIRGNNISDKGIIKLINGIPRMKSFFISETEATDLTGEEVATKLNDLEMFWSEHTRITNLVALKIAQKPKIKVLSLVGNPIEDEFKQKMKRLFISKGYIAL